jgi:hypothetical protein
MKFEHRSQKLLAFPNFLLRMLRFTAFAIGLIAVSLGIGMLGYHYLCGLGIVDSLYMSSMILTGMGPVPNVEIATTGAKLFSSAYALYSGVAFLSITAIFFSPIIHRLLHILQIDNDDKDS